MVCQRFRKPSLLQGWGFNSSALRQFAKRTDVMAIAADELEASAPFVQGQAPGAGQVHTLTPKGTVGSTPDPLQPAFAHYGSASRPSERRRPILG